EQSAVIGTCSQAVRRLFRTACRRPQSSLNNAGQALSMAWRLPSLLVMSSLVAHAAETNWNSTPVANRWWPVQAVPKALVRATNQSQFPSPRAAHEMLAQSVAGLAAKAVNEGRGDEMVWVATDNVDVEDWFARWLKRHPK